MGSASRTFKLRLSPAGIDLLLECHCRMMKATRRLLAGGATLQVAIDHLANVPARQVREALDRSTETGLSGSEMFFFYAPATVKDVAIRIAERVNEIAPADTPPALAHIYITALQQLATADSQAIQAAYDRVSSE